MHVVKTHRVAHTILRCQAIIVLISLQLRLITSGSQSALRERTRFHPRNIQSHCNVQKRKHHKEKREKHIWQIFYTLICV